MVDQVLSRAVPFGREPERAALDAVLDGVAAGRRGVVLIVGDAGVGKTTLVRHALLDRVATLLWATGDEAEGDLDHAVVDQLARVAPISDDERAAVLALVGRDTIRIGAAMVALVDGVEIDRGRPLVVVVDDAQWADRPSLEALTFAARRLRRDPVLLCLVVRPDGVDDLPPGLLRLVQDEGVRIDVGPLDRVAVRALAERELGAAVPSPVADRLLAHTTGNPLHLRALLAELTPEMLLGEGELPAPRSFASLVAAVLARASEAARDLVAAVAVLGDPASLRAAAAVAGLEDPAAAVDEAIGGGLLVRTPEPLVGGPSVATPHPLTRAAVLQDLAPGRRAQLHRRAGEVTTGLASLRHRLRGALGPDLALWEESRLVAEREARRGAHGSAAALLRAAAAVAPDEDRRQDALFESVEQLLLAGRVADASALRPQLEASERSPQQRYLLGRLAYVLGPRREARAHLLAAWDELEAANGDLRVSSDLAVRALGGRVAAMLATISVDRAEAEPALSWGRLALELDPVQAASASTTHMLAGAWALTGRFDEGLADLERICAAARAADLGDQVVADACCARGLLRLWTHDLHGAAEDLEAALSSSSGTGSFVGRESTRAYLAEVRYRQGRWDESVALAEVAAGIVDDTGQVWMAVMPHATAARPKAARGQPAERHLTAVDASAALAGGGIAAGFALVVRVEVAAAERDDDAAVAAGDALWSTAAADDRIAPWRASFVEALVARGRLEDAEAVAAELLASSTNALVRNDAARAQVAVAVGRGDDAAVDAAALAGLAEDPDVVGPYPRARLELAVGRAWRRRGERRRAVGVLEAALARFRALEATPWAAQAEQEIRASGLRPTRRAATTGADLTPQERAVANLVAQGRTNREVAAELVVSAKTVEHHLSRVYAKVGVRSRTELARQLLPES